MSMCRCICCGVLFLCMEYLSNRACWWCAWGNALAGRSLCNVNEDGGHALGASKITLHNDRGCSSLLVEFCRICGWHIWVWLNHEMKRCGFRCFVLVCILVSLSGCIPCWYSVVLERGRFMVEPFSEWVVVVVWLWHVFWEIRLTFAKGVVF